MVELPLALYLTVFGGLLIVSVFLDRLAGRLRQPGVLLVLLLGLLVNNDPASFAGPPPTLLSYERADELAQVAVAVVLFQGGSAPTGISCGRWCVRGCAWRPSAPWPVPCC